MTDDATPAATIMLCRDGMAGVEVLMVKRAATMIFAPSAMVFPGGAVDPGDHDLAQRWLPDADQQEAAAWIAAIRETIEECGVAIGLRDGRDGPVARDHAYEMQQALVRDAALFATSVEQHDLRFDAVAPMPWTRWRPSAAEAPRRRFDTRFYLVRMPDGQTPRLVGDEHVAMEWTTPAAMLERAGSGTASLLFPTRCVLERLGQCPTVADAIDLAHRYAPHVVTPWVEPGASGAMLCIPGDLGYPVTAAALTASRRE